MTRQTLVAMLTVVIRWFVKVITFVLAAFLMFGAVKTDWNDPTHQGWGLLGLYSVVLAGYWIAWRWERVGGWIIVGAHFIILLTCVVPRGGFGNPDLLFFVVLGSPGLFLLWCASSVSGAKMLNG